MNNQPYFNINTEIGREDTKVQLKITVDEEPCVKLFQNERC